MNEPTSRMTNREFAERDNLFRQSCIEANIPSTPRQASKYRRKRGIAYEARVYVQTTLAERRHHK